MGPSVFYRKLACRLTHLQLFNIRDDGASVKHGRSERIFHCACMSPSSPHFLHLIAIWGERCAFPMGWLKTFKHYIELKRREGGGWGCCVVLSLPLSRIFDHIQFNVIDCYKDDNTNISTSHPRESSMPRSCVSTSLMFELAIVNYFLRLFFLIHSLPPLFLSKCMRERFVCYFLLHPKLLSNL